MGDDAERNRVESGERFVVQHQFGVERDGARQSHAPRHAARQFGGHQFFYAAQADGVQLQQHQIADDGFGQFGQLAHREGDVVVHRQIGKQCAVLEQHAHAAAVFVEFLRRKGRQIAPLNQHLSRLRADLAGNQPHQRGFAAARTAHYRRKRALRDAEADISQYRTFAIGEDDVFHFDKRLGHGAAQS